MKIEKVEKLVANLHKKTEYVIHKRNLKQALNHGLVLKKLRRIINFNQNASLKYGEKAKLCYMDTDSFIVYIKNRGYL